MKTYFHKDKTFTKKEVTNLILNSSSLSLKTNKEKYNILNVGDRIVITIDRKLFNTTIVSKQAYPRKKHRTKDDKLDYTFTLDFDIEIELIPTSEVFI